VAQEGIDLSNVFGVGFGRSIHGNHDKSNRAENRDLGVTSGS
jgi:hypothetical protein